MTVPHPLWQPLFEPRSIALIGASGEPRKNTARPQQFLRRHGWIGRVVPINRSRSELFGEPAYPDLDAAPGEIDHAFVMVPAAQVAEVLEACGRRRVPVVTLYSDGFAEHGGDGEAAQRTLAARARELGIRLLGPNCIGLIDVVNRMPLTVNAALAGELAPAGRIAVISQSGSTLGTLLSRGQARSVGFSRLVSVGNEADLGVGELAHMLVADPHTDTIVLFLETLRDAPRLAQAARDAHSAGKAIVAYKLGRSRAGVELAVSHTGAIAGEDSAFDAFFAAHGIVRVQLLETLLEIAPLLRGQRPSAPLRRAPRVATVSTTGGGAAMVVDRLGMLGIEPAIPDQAFVETMAAQGITIRPAPVIDLTLAATPARYAAVLEALMRAGFCDAVLAVAGSSAQFQPSLAVEPMLRVAALERWDKPLACFLAPEADTSLGLLAHHGIAGFRTPEACADALAARLRWQAPRSPVEPMLPDTRAAALAGMALGTLRATLPVHDAVLANADAHTRAHNPAGRVLDEASALDLFDAIGIATVRREVLHTAPWRTSIAGPLAVKLISADLPHKTEAGAVRLNVNGDAELVASIAAMRASALAWNPAARIDGVLVQAMTSGIGEALLGYRDDPLLGPLITLGVGGTMAELWPDAATRVAPIDRDTAFEMVTEVRGLTPLRGWRGQPAANLDALADTLVALSSLASVPGRPVAEAEINPLIVSASGACAVDGLVVVTRTERVNAQSQPT